MRSYLPLPRNQSANSSCLPGNCKPRVEASHLKVNKENENHGRWFWRCRKCNFFLWDEDARAREGGLLNRDHDGGDESEGDGQPDSPTRGRGGRGGGGAAAPAATQYQPSLSRWGFGPVQAPGGDGEGSIDLASVTTDERLDLMSLAGQVSEAPATLPTTPSRLRTPTPATSVPFRAPDLPVSAGKRKRTAANGFHDSGDEDLFGELSSDEERQMAEAMERSSKKLQAAASLAKGKSVAFTNELPTPVTEERVTRAGLPGSQETPTRAGRSATTFTTSPHSPPLGIIVSANHADYKPSSQSSNDHNPPPSSALSTLSSFNDPHAAANQSFSTLDGTSSVVVGEDPPAGDDYAVTAQVLALLDGAALGPGVRAAVRETLNRHALRVRGVERGRDMVRSALAKKDARIAQLQDRVAALENLHRAERDRNRDMREGIERLRNLSTPEE